MSSLKTSLLTDARNLLADRWCAFEGKNAEGNYCAQGALAETCGYHMRSASCAITDENTRVQEYLDLSHYLNTVARELYSPSEEGKSGQRPDGMRDSFNSSPLVYINNHLGRDAALRVFDEGIKKLQEEAA